jgi:hypothetical protein
VCQPLATEELLEIGRLKFQPEEVNGIQRWFKWFYWTCAGALFLFLVADVYVLAQGVARSW